jgi:hypothetical protein
MSEDIRLVGIENVEPYPLFVSDDLYLLPAPTFIIEDFLPEGTISGVTSYPGVGKTWLAFEMARAIATGGRFLDHFPAHEGAVLFVGSDASIYDYARQWRRLTMEEFQQLQPDASSPLEYENPLKANMRFLVQSDFLFESGDAIRRLAQTIKKFDWGPLHEVYDEATGEIDMEKNHGFSLVIFDTLSKLTRVDQNSNTEMEEVFRNIRFLSEYTRASILLLHHNAKATEFKSGEDWRGAIAQIAALDNWYQLAPTRADKDTIRLKVKRFRGLTPPDFHYKMSVNIGEPGEEPPASLAVIADPQELVVTDGIAEMVVELLNTPEFLGKWWTLRQLTDRLYPQFADLFMNDRAKFDGRVRNRLKSEMRKTNPTVRMSGGGTRGTPATFSAGLMKQVLNEDPDLKETE